MTWLEAYGFWGFVWRGIVLGLPVAIALPLLHPQLFAPVDRLIDRHCTNNSYTKEKAPR